MVKVIFPSLWEVEKVVVRELITCREKLLHPLWGASMALICFFVCYGVRGIRIRIFLAAPDVDYGVGFGEFSCKFATASCCQNGPAGDNMACTILRKNGLCPLELAVSIRVAVVIAFALQRIAGNLRCFNKTCIFVCINHSATQEQTRENRQAGLSSISWTGKNDCCVSFDVGALALRRLVNRR